MARAADISSKRLISLAPENWVKKEKGLECYLPTLVGKGLFLFGLYWTHICLG